MRGLQPSTLNAHVAARGISSPKGFGLERGSLAENQGGSNSNKTITEDNDQLLIYAINSSNTTNTTPKVSPAEIRSLISKDNTSVDNHGIIYRMSSLHASEKDSLVDRVANEDIAKGDVRLIAKLPDIEVENNNNLH